jgi:DNA-directed RNA polymerase specialized sigma24 family protein
VEEQNAGLLPTLRNEHGGAGGGGPLAEITTMDRQRRRAVPEPSPDDDLTDRVVESWAVAEALRRLPAGHREVLVECFYRRRSVTEAAALLGVPPGTVKSRTHDALRSLRMILDDLGVTR